MLFCSQDYFLFMTALLAVYWLIPGRQVRVWLLLTASFAFYASWNHWLALIIAISTALDYVVARALEATSSPRWRRGLLMCSLILNLSLLAYFKYVNFFLESLAACLGELGVTTTLPLLQTLVPVGISFYTFEAINYTVDVYYRRIKAERAFGNFVLFITFFPHLLAGPIVRARDFLPQIARPKHWDWARFQLGLQMFLIGMFKKLAIADQMAVYANPVFDNPEAYGSAAAWIALVAYALQIYCDFSGYTDMAIGSAHMLGYKLAVNFNMPYLAANISEFWRRWHISLSSWLRDYLFIPLGGSRHGRWLTYRNLMITMTLGGLWHGANWTFVAWGVLHGSLLIGHRLFQDFAGKRPHLDAFLHGLFGTALRRSLTFFCVLMTWVFFRATNFTLASAMLSRLFVPHAGLPSPAPLSYFFWTVCLMAICHGLGESGWWRRVLILCQYRRAASQVELAPLRTLLVFVAQNKTWWLVPLELILLLVSLLALLSGNATSPFIYTVF